MNSSTRYNIVIDTNVMISGLVFGGLPRRVIDSVLHHKTVMFLSPDFEKEIVRKFREISAQPEILSVLRILLEKYSRKIVPTVRITKSRDPKDDMLLALAFAGDAHYLITGDKDLLVLRKFGKTEIVTPKEFFSLEKRKRLLSRK